MSKTYRIPMQLALITMVGLLFALFGDGVWDAASWVLLTIPLVVLAWKLARPSVRQNR